MQIYKIIIYKNKKNMLNYFTPFYHALNTLSILLKLFINKSSTLSHFIFTISEKKKLFKKITYASI
jgi:hypothetical protein